MPLNFPSIAAALASDAKQVRQRVWIAGVPTDCWEAHASHSVDQPIGTCTLVLPAPLPAHVAYNAKVLVQAGYPGAVRTIFSGRIPAHEAAIDERGKTARVSCAGWASLLAYPDYADLRFDGAISLKRIFQALCKRRRVPSYRAEEVLTTAGAVVRLGGVGAVDDGDVVIERARSPLDWLAEKAALFGYRVYDTPVGRVQMTRVSGAPAATPKAAYAEGVDCYRVERRGDTRPMVTYWEVFGARYTDADGRVVAVRSIPDAVPYRAELDPPGYRRDSKSDQALVTLALADAARNVLEVDYGAPTELATWEVDGAPDRQPGDVVTVTSATAGLAGNRWLTGIDQSVTDTQGYYATMTGWSGGGVALPAGDDCLSQALSGTVYHVGDDTIAAYADPSPDGLTVTVAFTVPDDYSSLTIEGEAHGCNSHFGESANPDSTPSMFEVWQLPDPTQPPDDDDNKIRKAGDGQLPIMEEDGVNWQPIAIPVTGSVKAGPAELRLTSGYDADTGDQDDYEVRNLVLVTCGVGQPDLPRERI